MSDVRYPVLELRQYTLHPGRRDTLIELFEREFVESQEAAGMALPGQFRDLDDPDRFVWLRGFPDMARRAEALGRFYGGPVWRAHRELANATMVDSDDVLLLRPVTPHHGFPAAAGATAARPPVGAAPPRSIVLATIYPCHRPFDRELLDLVERRMPEVLRATGAESLAVLRTEYAENNFPALPVRTGEHVVVRFARLPDAAHLDEHRRRLARSADWREEVLPALSRMLAGPARHLRLAPTARSLLR
jgi:hypothetical protein